MLRVVLDVNVLVSAAIGRDASPRRVVESWQGGAFEVVVSDLLLAELERVLGRREIAVRVDPVVISILRRLTRDDAIRADDPSGDEKLVPVDPRDDYLVALARAAGARVIVTGDRHLLDLEGLRPPAIEPAAFLGLVERLG